MKKLVQKMITYGLYPMLLVAVLLVIVITVNRNGSYGYMDQRRWSSW